MLGETFVVIVDFEKYRLAIDLKRPKIVFFVRVIGVAEIIVQGDGFNDASDGFGAEGGWTWAVMKAVPTVRFWRSFVVEGANGLQSC